MPSAGSDSLKSATTANAAARTWSSGIADPPGRRAVGRGRDVRPVEPGCRREHHPGAAHAARLAPRPQQAGERGGGAHGADRVRHQGAHAGASGRPRPRWSRWRGPGGAIHPPGLARSTPQGRWAPGQGATAYGDSASASAGPTRARSSVPVSRCSSASTSPRGVDPGHQVAAVVRDQRVHLGLEPRQVGLDAPPAARPSPRRCAPTPPRSGARVLAAGRSPRGRRGRPCSARRSRAPRRRRSRRAPPAPRSSWPSGSGSRAVDDVQDQVGAGDLLQRRAERLDQLVRQVPDEADRVGQGEGPPVRGRAPCGRSGPSVANSASSTSTPAPVSRLSSEDLPALV